MIAKSTTNAAGTSIRITKPTRFDVFTVFVVPTCILLVKAGVLSSVAVLERGSKKDLVVIAAGPNLYALADAEIGPAWSATRKLTGSSPTRGLNANDAPALSQERASRVSQPE